MAAPAAARWLWLLTWLSLMGLLTLYFHTGSQPSVTASGELRLPMDASGHYRLEGAINGQEVQLLLDTGAYSGRQRSDRKPGDGPADLVRSGRLHQSSRQRQ
jgi:hypothetical protein